MHPELTRESSYHASGNYAFLDLIAGLEWVQHNVAAFGGDPGNVTIFGHSAGAWAINNLMISPLARGLFHAAIAESEGGDMGPAGTIEGMALLAGAEQSGVAFATSLGAQSLAELRRIPADKIIAADFPGLPDIPNSNMALPIVDGYVIPGDPNGQGLPRWPPFTVQNQSAMFLGKSFTAGEIPDRPQHRLMDAYMAGVRLGGAR